MRKTLSKQAGRVMTVERMRRSKIQLKAPRAPFLASAIAILLLSIAGNALADWDPGDDYKMHYPQLPDSNGWDVYAEYLDSGYTGWPWWWGKTKRGLADDWQCNESGYVDDIHFWGSWKGDIVGTTGNIYAAILADDGGTPGDVLWDDVFEVGEYQERPYGSGDQGWFDPYTGFYDEHDHNNIYQYNISFIDNPFYQEEGEIYWLALSMNFVGCQWGWKTSQDHFGADAHYLLNMGWPPPWWQWGELIDPVSSQSLDMAFVITPEPATIFMLGFGAVGLLRKRKNT